MRGKKLLLAIFTALLFASALFAANPIEAGWQAFTSNTQNYIAPGVLAFMAIGAGYYAYEQKDPKKAIVMFLFAAALIAAGIFLAPDFAKFSIFDNNTTTQ